LSNSEIVIIGGGIAGLCCARRLQQEGIPCLILEGSDSIGGRIRTDHVEGFLLDRGFQILLTSYPEAQSVLDFPWLDLHSFFPGALIRLNDGFHKFADPWKSPLAIAQQLFSPVGSLLDKLRIAKLRWKVLSGSLDELLTGPESTTLDALKNSGFSPAIIDQFFKPFFGGVFLEPDLQTSSRLFHFLFRMFATGQAALPALGMERIPQLLASGLSPDSIRVDARVSKIESSGVVLEAGERIPASTIVLATEGPQAARLLSQIPRPASRSVTCLYFAADKSPLTDPILVVNSTGKGPINHFCVPSQIAPSYAPSGATLLSVTVLGKHKQQYEPLEEAVRTQLYEWFGSETLAWKHLKTYNILHALPTQEPPTLPSLVRPARLSPGLYICGDYTDTASINGAMASGRRAAEAVIQDLHQ
jgi:phytoene dehydrogenase-like protein